MFNLFRAEWKKVVKNYKLTTFLVWIYPVGMAAFLAILLIVQLSTKSSAQGAVAPSSGQWTADMLVTWNIVSSFPVNVFGRMLPLAFMAVVFAGEYQWGTWKNLVPRNRRVALILTKLAALTVIVMTALVSTSVIVGLGQSLGHRMAGLAYGPALTGEVLADFARDYAREALLGMISLLILAAFAGSAALLTRSILGGLLFGFGFSILEPSELWLVLSILLSKPEIVNLYRFTPTYNLNNVRSWLVDHSALAAVPPGFTAQPTLAFSVGILALWLLGLTALAGFVFQKQDITS
jgi:ABC-2 type transport system permease protein